MKQTEIIMGMPITIELIGPAMKADLSQIFKYFKSVDKKFSPYKADSEVTKYNNGLALDKLSRDMRLILQLAEETKKMTNGYFNVSRGGKIDPSGIVKGWSINEAAKQLKKLGYKNFFVEAGGDIQAVGKNAAKSDWQVGIRNPFSTAEIIKVVKLSNKGIATSGRYIRGDHIYNPNKADSNVTDIASLSVIGPNVYEADRFATAAFAMGTSGINFIETLPGFEAYMIDNRKVATLTSHFNDYVVKDT